MSNPFLFWCSHLSNWKLTDFCVFGQTSPKSGKCLPKMPINCLLLPSHPVLVTLAFVYSSSSNAIKMKKDKSSNSTSFDKPTSVSEYHSKLGSNIRKFHENTQGFHTEDCTKSFRTKNQVSTYLYRISKFLLLFTKLLF